MRLAVRAQLAAALALAGAALLGVVVAREAPAGWPPVAVFTVAAGCAVVLGLLVLRAVLGRAAATLDALSDALAGLADRDFGRRVAARRSDEIGELARRYNAAAEALRQDRVTTLEKEVLLDTVLQAAPMAVVLVDPAERVVFANRGARELLALRGRGEGQSFADVVEASPPPLAQALTSRRDALFTIGPADDARQDGEDETYRLVRRRFELNGRPHELILLERLTPELRRQEVAVWKRAIRTMSHELNNSLAPIASLSRSAQRMQGDPAHVERLAQALAVIGERAEHLREFLDGYARFARLPQPQPRDVEWSRLVDELREVASFRMAGEPPVTPARLDPGQMQQVLINLLRNAAEAGSPPEETVLAIAARSEGGFVVRLDDRGRGMTDEELGSALLPFFSTKRSGSGIGLPLCREIVEAHGGRLRLERRAGGGTTVVLWLP
jgi:nitrogen fixation/metabolism regulation signal transduction histidine kinase